MNEIKKIGDLYSDFFRIDLDARGGYARVAKAKIVNRPDLPEHCAFKIMRHELGNTQKGMDRFEVELQTLIKIIKDDNFPSAITKIYDSGFVNSRVSQTLQKPDDVSENINKTEKINPEWGIISTGTDINAFLNTKSDIESDDNHWLPYLAVELAPYEHSLFRQIHQYSIDPTSNPHLFPVGEVVSMALQLLDVIEYLQQQELAYMDWKPEHIYWDNQTQQVKLIDWNVTNILQNNNERKNIIHEDLRLFCGAALYCSMTLSDPEDMQKPIGPKPKHNNPSSFLRTRYLTDEPNFYERSVMFDSSIKQLVKKGLDPAQGFNTPQELKNALLDYAKKNLKSPPENDHSNTQTLISGIPRDAVQNYRRARSYISAGDFQFAMDQLIDAVETARKRGVGYTDAESLLITVKNRLASDEFKQNAKSAIKNKNWKDALDFYDKALKQDPTNVITSKELDDVQSILRTETETLRKQGVLTLFSNLKKLRVLAEAARNVSGSDISLLKSIDRELNQAKVIKSASSITLLIGVLIILFTSGLPAKLTPFLYSSNTPTITITQTNIPVMTTSTIATTPKPVISITSSITRMPTLTPTITLTPTPTEVIFGIGYINKLIASAWNEPNRGLITKLASRQTVILLERRIVSNSTWFRCRWEINGVTAEGWILEDNITLGAPPTPGS